MKFEQVFKPQAWNEFNEAILWYETQRPGLGREFAGEVIQSLEKAQLNPEIFRPVRGRARCIRLKRFKAYSIYFAIKENVFSVISIFHGARNPAELRGRLK